MICLLHMPFSNVTEPSLALSIFKAELDKIGLKSWVEYANLEFFKKIGVFNYMLSAETLKNAHMAGEYVFLPTTGFAAKQSSASYLLWLRKNIGDYMPENLAERFLTELPALQCDAAEFIGFIGDKILEKNPQVIACASTYFQINSTISILKYIKEKNPNIVTIVGGANCSGKAGLALVNKIPWIDFSFSGEADECIADFCQLALQYGKHIPKDKIPYGVLAKNHDLKLSQEVPCRITHDLNKMCIPDFDDYFAAIDKLELRSVIEPGLNIEFSRGCWWGEKRPCTFCGLNGQVNHYRSKSPQRILKELDFLSEKYCMTKFALADNILDQNHLKELVPLLAERSKKYCLFVEIKSNISRDNMKKLREAGFYWLQPGLESLQDDILQIMNKGNSAIRHVEFLKNAHELGIALAWNLIGGFPGEKDEWYEELADTIWLISHLHPPSVFKHIVFQRFSAYLENENNYGLSLKTAEVYDFVLPDLPGFVENMAYQYEPTLDDPAYRDIGKKSNSYQKVQKLVREWITSNRINPDRLEYWEESESLLVMDLRKCAVSSMYVLAGVERAVYLACSQVQTKVKLVESLQKKFFSHEIYAALKFLEENRLLLCIGDDVLALATRRGAEKVSSFDNVPTGFIKKDVGRQGR